jgi:transcription initiation factor TFIIIB Brf1 subunit/transcription initiation factor TFIIB
MNDVKELERQGCRTFICPNLNLIDEKGNELGLRDTTIKRSKDMAIEFFKKTYHKPHYSSARYVIPGIVYIASIVEDDRRSQNDIIKVFDISPRTIKKWYRDVMIVLGIKILKEKKQIKIPVIDIDREFCEIDKEGKALSLEDDAIESAKNLASKYYVTVDFDHYRSHIRQLRSAFLYTASIIENDSRRQMDIYRVTGVAECTISKWHKDILKVLGMKIIKCGSRVSVLENQDDED